MDETSYFTGYISLLCKHFSSSQVSYRKSINWDYACLFIPCTYYALNIVFDNLLKLVCDRYLFNTVNPSDCYL